MNDKTTKTIKKAWKYFWHDDSFGSWILNIIVAFLLIRFIVYPVLGIIFGTNFPIVAVVSESMEHSTFNEVICGKNIADYKESFDNYWNICGNWYEQRGINKEQFKRFSFQNGFNKGDVIILWRAHEKNLEIGDVLVFQATRPQPIIHRIVAIKQEDGKTYYQTKGDHNSDSIDSVLGEKRIDASRIEGKGIVRIPYLGWMKILFVEAVRPFGINIQR
ncbi:signal peptidase I [Candidatus Woesearchaeota archaeon]|nr:signal peptidase I [Candidatus Woesearchaeota archaeon]